MNSNMISPSYDDLLRDRQQLEKEFMDDYRDFFRSSKWYIRLMLRIKIRRKVNKLLESRIYLGGSGVGRHLPQRETDDSSAGDSNVAVSSQPSQPVFLPLIVVFGAAIAAQLISLAFGRSDNEQSFASIFFPSILFLSFLTLPLALIGIVLGRQIGLGTPLIAGLLSKQPGSLMKLRKDLALAGALGVTLGGMLLLLRMICEPYLPSELPAFGHRGVIGGLSVSLGAAVAEEVWFRLGLMTLMVWCVARLLGHREARPIVAWPIVVITAFGFGLAHLPQLTSYGAGSPFAIGATIIGNSVVGVLYGWCYWRRSLIAAMIAHFSADVVLHVLPALVK